MSSKENKKQEWVDELIHQTQTQIERGRVDDTFKEVAENMYEKAQQNLREQQYPEINELFDWWQSYGDKGPSWASVASLIARKRKEGRQELRQELAEKIAEAQQLPVAHPDYMDVDDIIKFIQEYDEKS